MPKKLKILISAYACGPNRGSEPGMGWNFVMGLAKYHELHVLTEQRKWEVPIKEYFKEYPEQSNNITFHFIEKKRNKKLRKIWPPSYYWFYKVWQQKAYKKARELDATHNFNVIHQLNMVGYREPGYLWKIDKPFVWGPIGGLENSTWSFLPSLGFKGTVFYAARNIINTLQQNFAIRPALAAKRENNRLIAATPENQKLIEKLWNHESTVIAEVGGEYSNNTGIPKRNEGEPLAIVWSGLHIPRKNLSLLLEALKRVDFPYVLQILGKGEMTASWRRQAQKLNLDSNTVWHGWLPKDKALEIMNNGHVFCITSISDLTSTVTLEALSYGVPIVCLDHCGFSHVVNSDCGIKIPVTTPGDAAENISQALTKLYKDEPYRRALSEGAIQRASDFDWPSKIEKVNNIYKDLLSTE